MFDFLTSGKVREKPLIKVMQLYQSFEDIPLELRDEEHLTKWLRSGYGKLEEIPLTLVTDEMRMAFIRGAGSLTSIRNADTPNYQTLALNVIEDWPGLILQVDPQALTEEFVFKAVSFERTGSQVLSILLEHWDDRFLGAISHRVMDTALSRSLIISAQARTSFPLPQAILDMLTDEQVRQALVDRTYELAFLSKMEKLHLLSQAMIAGYWPSPADTTFFNNAPQHLKTRKASLAEAIEERTRDKNGFNNGLEFECTPLRVFFEAYILTFPIEEVLAHCKTPAHARMAGEIYTQAELKPHLKNNHRLKGHLLEDSLGL